MRNVDHSAGTWRRQRLCWNASIFHESDGFSLMPLFSEVDITPLLQAAPGRRLALPRSNGDDTTFVEVKSLDELMPGSFGTRTGAGVEIQPTLIRRHRSCFGVYPQAGASWPGKGFYDRYLSAFRSDEHRSVPDMVPIEDLLSVFRQVDSSLCNGTWY